MQHCNNLHHLVHKVANTYSNIETLIRLIMVITPLIPFYALKIEDFGFKVPRSRFSV